MGFMFFLIAVVITILIFRSMDTGSSSENSSDTKQELNSDSFNDMKKFFQNNNS